MNYQDFDAVSLMQQAPDNFLSPETMASMPSFSSAASGPSFDQILASSFGQSTGNANLSGAYMPLLQSTMTPRFGVGGVMAQPDNSGSLPGATTTLPTSPEQPKAPTATQATNPFSVPEGVDPTTAYILGQIRDMKKDDKRDFREEADYIFDKEKERAERANKMGQWNNILAAGLKLPDRINDAFARRNMYLGDMLRSSADAAREQAAGIRQIAATNPGASVPARNYIRI